MEILLVPTKPWSTLDDDERTQFILFCLLALVSWGAAFILCKYALLPKQSFDLHKRVVADLHTLAALSVGSWSVTSWHNPMANLGGPNTQKQTATMILSFSYFVYDFLVGLLSNPIDWLMAIHHAFTLVGFAFGILSGTCGTELVSFLWLMELSTPCLHARDYIKELGLKDTLLYTLNELLFAVAFTFARMVIGPFVVVSTLQSSSPVGVKVGAVGIQLVSVFWFYKLLRAIYYKVTRKGKRREVEVKKEE